MTPVVDIHGHLMAEAWLPARWWDAKADRASHPLELRGESPDWDALRAEGVARSADPTGERLLARMDETAIDHQVLFPVDWGVPLGDPPVPIRAFNDRIRAFVADHADRCSAFVTIDPRREGALEYVAGALDDWAVGLKLHPATGFYPTDDATYDLLTVADDHGAPVLFHTGGFVAPMYSEPCHPHHLDRVVSDFPNLSVIAAHLGHEWHADLLDVARRNAHTNLRVGLSGWQPRFAADPDGSARVVRGFVDILGSHRVHFATDYPVFFADHPPGEWVSMVRALADRTTDPTFSKREVAEMLGGGAAALLDLN